MHPVTMQYDTKKGFIERKKLIEVWRVMGKYLLRVSSWDGHRVDALCSCNVVNARRNEEGIQRKEETHRSYKRDGEVSLASEIQQCTVDASGNNSEKHKEENHRQEENT